MVQVLSATASLSQAFVVNRSNEDAAKSFLCISEDARQLRLCAELHPGDLQHRCARA